MQLTMRITSHYKYQKINKINIQLDASVDFETHFKRGEPRMKMYLA